MISTWDFAASYALPGDIITLTSLIAKYFLFFLLYDMMSVNLISYFG